MKLNRLATAIAGAALVLGVSLSASATHSWNNYHWARTTSSFTLQTLDSTVATSYVNWPAKLSTAAGQWSQSNVLDLAVSAYANGGTARKKCSAVLGKIRVCNASYGRNGWLGLASININGSHITQGTAKMNDSYTSTWAGDPNEAAHVMCQEVGHTFGLGHTSEDGSTQNTCMDYSSSPTSTAPNAHDYDELALIYQHLDSTTTVASSPVNTTSQQAMAGQVPMGVRVVKGRDFEVWAAPDGHGGTWIHHVTLAPVK
jgi:hypothetical protein